MIPINQIEQDRERGVPSWTAIVEAAVLARIPLSRGVFCGPTAMCAAASWVRLQPDEAGAATR